MQRILGADVFAIPLLLFIIITSILFKNSNRTETDDADLKQERSMPAVSLYKGQSRGIPAGVSKKTATVSARVNGKVVQYYLDEEPVQLNELINKFKKRQIAAVNLRFDKNINYGKYVLVMDMCLRAGIDNIFTVYEMNDKGG